MAFISAYHNLRRNLPAQTILNEALIFSASETHHNSIRNPQNSIIYSLHIKNDLPVLHDQGPETISAVSTLWDCEDKSIS